jgi:hypothetical protein
MRAPLKRLTTLAGITCAMAATGPVAVAAAATPGTATQTPLPGQSCSVDQGLPSGIPNLGPTGPLGPLGSKGPLGGNNSNLPCGASAVDVGPGGPLGPGGALGSISSPAPQSAPAPQSSPAPQTSPAKKHTSPSTRPGDRRRGASEETCRAQTGRIPINGSRSTG